MPTPETPTAPVPEKDPVKEALFSSLKLTLAKAEAPESEPEAPVPNILLDKEDSDRIFGEKDSPTLTEALDAARSEAAKAPAKEEPKSEETTPPAETTPPVTEPVAPVAETAPVAEEKPKPEEKPKAPKKGDKAKEDKPKAEEMLKFKAPELAKSDSVVSKDDDEEFKPVIPANLDLLPEEIEELELAQYAATKDKSYADQAKKLEKFFKDHNEYLLNRKREDPHWTPDPREDEKYGKWLQENRVGFKPGDRRKFEKTKLIEDAKREARKETDEKLKKVERKVWESEIRPEIDKAAKEFRTGLYKTLPEEIAKVSEDKLDDEVPFEAPVVKKYLNGATDAAKEFLNLSNGLSEYDHRNPMHKWLFNFIDEQGRIFANSGRKDLLEQNGRTFMPRAEYNLAKPAEREGRFTFTDGDILSLLAYNAKLSAEAEIKQGRELLEKSGYVRKSAAPVVVASPIAPVVAATPPKEEPAPSPKAKPGITTGVTLDSPKSNRDAFLRSIIGNSQTTK